jgi:hypothetical protein
MKILKNIPTFRFVVSRNHSLIPIFVTFPDFDNLPKVNNGIYIYFNNGKPFKSKPLPYSFYVDFENTSKIKLPKGIIKITTPFIISLVFKIMEKKILVVYGLVTNDYSCLYQNFNFLVFPKLTKDLIITKSLIQKKTKTYLCSTFTIQPTYKLYHIPLFDFYKAHKAPSFKEYLITWDLKNWSTRTIKFIS